MRRVGRVRLGLILLILLITVFSLATQDVSILGLKRGSDAILGMRLGLDLKGGSLLIYQARGTHEVSIAFRDPVDLEAVRSVFADVGKTDAVVQQDEAGLVKVQLGSLKPEQRDTEGSIIKLSEKDEIKEALEQQMGNILTFEVADVPASVTLTQMEGVMEIINRRINPFGITEPETQIMDKNRILVQLPGVKNVEEIKRLIGQTARLEIKERTCLSNVAVTLANGQTAYPCGLPDNHVDKETGLTGDDLARTYPGTHPQTGLPIVNIQFNSRGASIFADLTTRIAGTDDRFVFFLDNDEIIAPVVVQPILSGNGFIEGPGFTSERVRTISIQLESGRLPIPIEVVQEQDVDATLGSESLRKSLLAGIAGLGLVFLFMAMYYRNSGVVAALALILYTAMVLTILKLVPITLTLAGVAGFILSIGMAVDANILIFERMKEELRVGRTLASAIEIGFNRAWPAIRDSNASTLIICGILIWFGQRLGTTLLAGFGTTLAIGVTLSMFSAIFISKTLLNLLSATPFGRQKSWFTPESLAAPSRSSPSESEE